MTAPMTQADLPNPFVAFMKEYAPEPVRFVREVLGVGDDVFVEIKDGPDAGRRIQVEGIFPNQLELLEAYKARERRIAKKSGHGVGKTTSLAWCIVHHNCTRFPQKTACTAPTKQQLWDALYSETVKWFDKLPPILRDRFDIKAESIHFKAAPKESFTTFKTASPDNPEALAGVHSDWTLLIGDEASGIPEANYEASAGSMSGHNSMMILAGNPVRTSGLFFDIFNKPEVMGDWRRISVSCIGHPNVTDDFLRQMKNQYGEGTNAWRVRVMGEFPLAESNTVIPYELVHLALDRDVKPLPVRPVWGLDPGLEADPSAIAKRQGNVLMEPTEEFRPDGDPMKLVQWVKTKWDSTLPSALPSSINVDSIGIGVGVAYRLMEMGLPARAVNVSELPSMRDSFPRLRDELWWRGREWFQKRDSNICGDQKLADELVRPTYDPTVANKIKVEGKRETKKRTKKPSPNRADAFLLTLATESEVMQAGMTTRTQSHTWNQPLEREIKGIV